MPTIHKQNLARVAKPSSNGSTILSRVIPIADLEDDWIKMVIYGENRVGKSTLSSQFPKPLLLLAKEPNKTGGAKSIRKVAGVDFLRINNLADSMQLAEELRQHNKYKTVVIDSATSYQDVVLMSILGADKLPEQLDWGVVTSDQYRERAERTKEGLRPFLNLDCHTVVTAKQKNHNRQEERKPKIIDGVLDLAAEPVFAADLGGATAGWLNDTCDYIAQLFIGKEQREVTRKLNVAGKIKEKVEWVETGKSIRRLRTMYHTNYVAGFRSENPEAVPEFIDNPTYEKIARVIAGLPLKEKL